MGDLGANEKPVGVSSPPFLAGFSYPFLSILLNACNEPDISIIKIIKGASPVEKRVKYNPLKVSRVPSIDDMER